MSLKFKKLNNSIVKCRSCPRLIKFSKKISIEKRKQNINDTYWAKPVTGFGDINAKLLIVGLAPAAHGGTRTGRAFTGDKSGDFLFKCLYETGISNLSISLNRNDGLILNQTYITNILKCVPPEDKPLSEEVNNCSNYFNNEIHYLNDLKVIITLGKVAFESVINFYKKKSLINKKFFFKHGKKYKLPDKKILLASYHPSPRNVNTKVINHKMMKHLLRKAKCLF
jgi:uracil-DNA glycosylase